MQIRRHTLLVAAALLSSTSFLRAQTVADPSGHWEGSIHVPDREIGVEIDLAKKATGDAVATFTGVSIKGFPLSDIVIEGASVRFELKVDGGGLFSAKLSDDGASLSGEFTTTQGGYTLPFNLTRKGDARFAPQTHISAIGKDLEGSWNGTLAVNGVPMRIAMKLANQPDGSATGSVANLDQGPVEIPVSAITQKASTVNIDVAIVNGTYSGALNAAGTEMTGTWTQGAFVAPLTLKRVAAADGRR